MPSLCVFPTASFSIYGGFVLPQASWIALLSIATHYEFLNVRERAIREIYGPFDGKRKRWASKEEMETELRQLISVAEKYDVPPGFIIPLLTPFVIRPQPLTEDEVLGFSALTVSRLAHAREDFQRGRRSLLQEDAKEIVCRIWLVQQVQKDE
jgi:hypothetical protein